MPSGVALVAGTGGFALGHATAGDDRDGLGRPAFGTHDGPGAGFPQQPPPGFQGGQDDQGGFDPRGDDGDDGTDEGQDLPDGATTQGSSNS